MEAASENYRNPNSIKNPRNEFLNVQMIQYPFQCSTQLGVIMFPSRGENLSGKVDSKNCIFQKANVVQLIESPSPQYFLTDLLYKIC